MSSPLTPGTPEYYKAQIEASKKSQEQKAQEQAAQQLAYEAYQKANVEKQQASTPQTITKQDIQTAQQNILDTKYVNRNLSTPEQTVYSIPVVTQEARDNAVKANYADYQKTNLDLQKQSIAQEQIAKNAALIRQNYDLFRQNQVMQTSGGYTAYGRLPVRYSVDLEDSVSGPKQYYYNPANPFDISDKAPPKPSKSQGNYEIPNNPADQYGEGFRNVFSNFGALLGGPRRPELEGDVYSAISSSGGSGPKGGFVLFTPQSIGALGKVGADILKSPLYYAGSAVGSASIFAATAGGGDIARFVGFGGKEVAQVAKVPKFGEPGYARAQLENVARQNARFTGERARFGVASIDTPKPDVWFLRSQAIARQTRDIDAAEAFKDPLGSRFAPKDITIFKPADLGGEPVNIGRTSGGNLGFQTKQQQVQKSVATTTDADRIQQSLDQDAARITPDDAAAKSAADLAQAKQDTSKITALAQDETQSAVAASTANQEISAGISQQASSQAPGVALGFGGLTGAERQRKKALAQPDFIEQYLALPPQANAFGLPQDALSKLSNTPAQAGVQNVKSLSGLSGRLTSGQVPGTEVRQVNRQLLGLDNYLLPRIGERPITLAAPSTLLTPAIGSLQTPRSVDLLDIKTVPQTLSIPRGNPIPKLDIPKNKPTPKPDKVENPSIFRPFIGATARVRIPSKLTEITGLSYGKTLWRVDPLLKINKKALDNLFGLGSKSTGKRARKGRQRK